MTRPRRRSDTWARATHQLSRSNDGEAQWAAFGPLAYWPQESNERLSPRRPPADLEAGSVVRGVTFDVDPGGATRWRVELTCGGSAAPATSSSSGVVRIEKVFERSWFCSA